MTMRQYAITVDEELVKKVDEICKEMKIYHSRNEFFRDAIRSKILEIHSIMKGGGEEEEDMMAEALAEEEESGEHRKSVH